MLIKEKLFSNVWDYLKNHLKYFIQRDILNWHWWVSEMSISGKSWSALLFLFWHSCTANVWFLFFLGMTLFDKTKRYIVNMVQGKTTYSFLWTYTLLLAFSPSTYENNHHLPCNYSYNWNNKILAHFMANLNPYRYPNTALIPFIIISMSFEIDFFFFSLQFWVLRMTEMIK